MLAEALPLVALMTLIGGLIVGCVLLGRELAIRALRQESRSDPGGDHGPALVPIDPLSAIQAELVSLRGDMTTLKGEVAQLPATWEKIAGEIEDLAEVATRRRRRESAKESRERQQQPAAPQTDAG